VDGNATRPFLIGIDMDDHSANTISQLMTATRAERLARAFSLMALDLSNPWDESADRFFPFHAALDDVVALDAQGLRAPLGVGNRYRLDISDPDLVEVADNWGGDAAVGFRLLDALMRASLTDVKLVFARADGVLRVRTWLLGRLPGQGLVGLRTESTET
jgi:hypothetical protein